MSIITMKSLPRRTVLRGLGVTLALPFLDAMVPAFSLRAKAAAKPLHRFQAIYVPNGMAMPYWTPEAEGSNFELTPILEPLAPFRNQLLVLSGLRASWMFIHPGASTSFLTGTAGGERTETEHLAGTSIDQMLAREFGTETQLASLELSMEREASSGQCGSDLSCAYTQTISWRTPTTPLPMESNPRAVFERLFGDSGSGDPAARRARIQQKKSILDSVVNKLADLRRQIGSPDQAKIDEYAAAVRDVERRIQLAEEQDLVDPSFPEPQAVPEDFEEHLTLMFNLQLLALQSNLTRVITFMFGREQSARTYPQIGVLDAHHPLSHHENKRDRVALMSKINTYHVKLFSDYYLAKLRATPDGDGSLLDHMTILYGTGMSNSMAHVGINLPLLLLGGGAGRLKGGRHLKYAGDITNANLLLTLLDKFDMSVDRIGNSTGPLPIDEHQIQTLSGL